MDDLTPQQIKALRLADNKTNELAGWDFGELALELEGLLDMDMERFGFDLEDSEEEEETSSIGHDEQWQIVIDCDSESDMEWKYNKIQGLGIECRTSTS